MVPLCSADRCQSGLRSHRSFVSLSTIARREGSDKSARAATIFIHNGAPQALVGSQDQELDPVRLRSARVLEDLCQSDKDQQRRLPGVDAMAAAAFRVRDLTRSA